MKKLLLCLLVLACCIQIFAQDERLIQEEEIDDAFLLEQLNKEKNELAVLEKELTYFHDLLQQKAHIRELYDEGKISAISQSLNKQTKLFDKLFDEDNREEISSKLGELRIIYGDVPEIKDQILYYQARFAYLEEKLDKARNLLIDLTQNYPQSSLRDPGLLLLMEIYHLQGYAEEFVALADQYTGSESILLSYWMAHAYFNTGQYDLAEEKFTALLNDENFAFRAKSMLALISYFTKDLQTAIEAFQALATQYESSTKYYDFVILSLARLSVLNDELALGLKYYQQYYDLQKQEVSDEILYEMATEYKHNNQYKEAVKYLNMIIAKPRKSEYYTSAKFLLAVTQYGYEDLDQTEKAIQAMIAENDELLGTLNRKYKLISDYHNIRRQLTRIDTTSYEYINLKAQLAQVDAMLQDTNERMEDFYKGLDAESLVLLIALEDEYKAYCSTISEMEALVLLSRNIPGDKISDMIDDEIQYGDSASVSLEIIGFLGHRAFYSQSEYNLAQNLAIEKVLQKIDLQIWKEIKVIAQDNNHIDLAEKVGAYVRLVEDNLIAFEIIAEYMFGGKPSPELLAYIQAEINSVESNKLAMDQIREDVIANFSTKISQKLNNEKQFLAEEFDLLKTKYDDTLNLVIDDVATVADKYKINLLGILFQKTQEMDKKYKELQEKVRNE